MTVEEIAKKHNVSVSKIEEQLKIGMEIEKEHTEDEESRREYALDHISEIPDYYTRLKKMEDEAREELGLDTAFKKWSKGSDESESEDEDEDESEEDEDEDEE